MIALVKLLIAKLLEYFGVVILNITVIIGITIVDINEYLKTIGLLISIGFSIWWWYHKWKQSKKKEQENEL